MFNDKKKTDYLSPFLGIFSKLVILTKNYEIRGADFQEVGEEGIFCKNNKGKAILKRNMDEDQLNYEAYKKEMVGIRC